MVQLNVFRILADVSHTVSKCILIWAIHSNSSAEGISLITQALYAILFCARYLDLFWSHPFARPDEDPHYRKGGDRGSQQETMVFLGLWNFFLKIFYIGSSLYILAIMTRVYSRTHEREKAWRFGAACLGGALLAAPFVMMVFDPRPAWSFVEFLWTFSEILESVAVLPQLLLLRQTSVPTVIDSFYLLTLGSYRAFYILNWIVRGTRGDVPPRTTAVVFGVVQTAFYLDFAWVYWSRQRVKLRAGALVDSDDLSRGWLVRKILRRTGEGAGDGDGGAGAGGFGAARAEEGAAEGRGWGARGISVSADEDGPPRAQAKDRSAADGVRSHKASDRTARPEETAGILHGDEEDDSEVDEVPASLRQASDADVGGGGEWR